MEQLVARRAHNPKVVGSSPAPATQKVKSLKSKDLRLFLFIFKKGKLPKNALKKFTKIKGPEYWSVSDFIP
ncbi:MAG: hypothetical protein JWP71_2261 [Mucilaginibacter sp.]|nr:hypothetical protein [Mucilaginibacter sp.]